MALVLALFISYQVWVKPTYLTSVPTELERFGRAAIPSVAEPTFLDTQKSAPWDVPPSRLLDPGSPPDPKLGAIRDEIDRGNYNEAEWRLRNLPPKRLMKFSSQQYVAALWNNLGVQQEKFGGTLLSVKAFKQAGIWDPSNPIVYLNLTQSYWELRDPAMTPQFLEKAVHLAPDDPFPHLALADLLLSKGNFAQAATHLAHARPRAERDPNHQSYFRRLMAKVETSEPRSTAHDGTSEVSQATDGQIARFSEPPVDRGPSPSPEPTRLSSVAPKEALPRQPADSGTAHFTVQFDGQPDLATWIRIRAILEYAFEELSGKFGHVPSTPVAVVLHTNQKFSGEGGSPAWADRLFDQRSGVIHLPTQDAFEDLSVFSRIARHEFAHALFFEHLKGGNASVPSWLVEGLSMQLAEDPWPELEDAVQKVGPVIPLTSLAGDWKLFSGQSRQVAYLEAQSATRTLVDRYSMYGVRQVMNQLQAGRSLDTAMQQKLSVSYEQFQREWEQTHRSLIRPNG